MVKTIENKVAAAAFSEGYIFSAEPKAIELAASC